MGRVSGQSQSYLSLLTLLSCLSLLGCWPWVPPLRFLHMVASEASSRKPFSMPLFLLPGSLRDFPFYCDPLSQLWTLKVTPALSTCRGQEGDVPDCTLVRLRFHAPCLSLSVCNCVHGVCSRGPQGNGSCQCFAGYTGPHCDQGEQC